MALRQRRDSRVGLTTPMPVIFIGLLGGTFAHGIVGLFIGPIILAVGWELMMAWIRDEKAREISSSPARSASRLKSEGCETRVNTPEEKA